MKLKKSNTTDLKVFGGLDGLKYYSDIRYIARILRKVSKELPRHRKDYDWLKYHIENFLILNSRVYSSLISHLIQNIGKRYKVDPGLHDWLILAHNSTLSFQYHLNKNIYRHGAAHNSIHSVVGVPEFANKTLPKPIRYHPTFPVPMTNMARSKDLISMWQTEMLQCAEDIDRIVNDLVQKLNLYDDPVFQKDSKYNFSNVDFQKISNELEELSSRLNTKKKMTPEEITESHKIYADEKNAIFAKYIIT